MNKHNLKKGDTFDLKCTVTEVGSTGVHISLDGDTKSNGSIFLCLQRSNAFKNIKRAEVELQAGQCWKNHHDYVRRIVHVEDGHAFYIHGNNYAAVASFYDFRRMIEQGSYTLLTD